MRGVGKPVAAAIAFLRCGQPRMAPSTGYIPLLALMARRLTDAEAQMVAAGLFKCHPNRISDIDIAAAILCHRRVAVGRRHCPGQAREPGLRWLLLAQPSGTFGAQMSLWNYSDCGPVTGGMPAITADTLTLPRIAAAFAGRHRTPSPLHHHRSWWVRGRRLPRGSRIRRRQCGRIGSLCAHGPDG